MKMNIFFKYFFSNEYINFNLHDENAIKTMLFAILQMYGILSVKDTFYIHSYTSKCQTHSHMKIKIWIVCGQLLFLTLGSV